MPDKKATAYASAWIGRTQPYVYARACYRPSVILLEESISARALKNYASNMFIIKHVLDLDNGSTLFHARKPMNNGRYTEEIVSMLRGEEYCSDMLSTNAGEKCMENAVLELLRQLVDIKNSRSGILINSDDAKLSHYFGQIKEILQRKERVNKRRIHLSQTLTGLFMDGEPADSAPLKSKVVENAEEWAYIVKRMHEEINTKTGSFAADKVFWNTLYERVANVRNFACSEEYKFLLRCLEHNGNIVLKYTLENLFRSEKLYKLACLFVAFYTDLDCSIWSSPGESCSADHRKLLAFLDNLKKSAKQPRIVKRTIYRLINSLRRELLISFCGKPHEKQLEIFEAFNSLVRVLSECPTDTHSQCTTITVEDLHSMDRYMWDVQQTCAGLALLEGMSVLGLEEHRTDMVAGMEQYAQCYKCRVNSEMGNIDHRDSGRLPPIEETGPFVRLLKAAASLFNGEDQLSNIATYAGPDTGDDALSQMASKMQRYHGFFAYRQFAADTSRTRNEYLHFLNSMLLGSLKNETPDGMLATLGRIELMARIVGYYEDGILLGSLRSMMECARQRIRAYLEALPMNVLDLYVVVCDNSDVRAQYAAPPGLLVPETELRDAETLLAANQKAGTMSVPKLVFNNLDKQLATIRQAARLNEHFKLPQIITMQSEAAAVEAEYHSVKDMYDRYCNFLADDGQLYRSPIIEEYLDRLGNLKWRRALGSLTEERLIEIGRELNRLEVSRCLFTKLFDELITCHLAELYGGERGFVADPSFYLRYFTHADFDRAGLAHALSHRMPVIAGVYCDILIDKLTDSLRSPSISITKYNLIINSSLFDEYHLSFMDGQTVPVDQNYLDTMHKLTLGLPLETENILSKRARIEELIVDGWTAFSNRCFNALPSMAIGYGDDALLQAYFTSSNRVISYLELFRNRLAFINAMLAFAPDDLLRQRNEVMERMVGHSAMTIGDAEELIAALPVQEFAKRMDNPVEMACYLECQEALRNINRLYKLSNCAVQIEEQIKMTLLNIKSIGADDTDRRNSLERIMDAMDKHTSQAFCRLSEMGRDRLVSVRSQLESYTFSSIEDIPLREIEEGRSHLLNELAQLRAECSKVSFDESIFADSLEKLSGKKDELTRRIRRYNYTLRHYKLDPIDSCLEIDMEKEYDSYRRYSRRLSEILSIGLMDFVDGGLSRSIDGLLRDAQRETPHSEELGKLCSQIKSYEKPLEYAKDLCCYGKYFDVTCSIKEYLQKFNESAVIETIRLGKNDKEIADYLENAGVNIFDALAINKSGMVSNIGEMKELLSEEWSNFDVICKFNSHGLYLDRLEAVGERIARSEDLFNLLSELQPDIYSLGNIPLKSILNERCALYKSLLKGYQTVVAGLQRARPAEEDMGGMAQLYCSRIVDLTNLQGYANALKRELKSYLDAQRNEAPRLFYVSDEQLIRAMNDPGSVKSVLIEIFNIQEVLEKNGHIIGMAALTERMIFGHGVSLAQGLPKIVTDFHAEIKAYLKACFDSERKGKIQMIDDLLVEYKYFTGLSKETNNTIDVLNRVSTSCPDVLGLYAKPNIAGDTLCIGTVPYMFEYYPPTSFIFTALTSRIFSSIILNIHRPGIILYGPSGTGKTETVRYFCRTLGHPLYTFCCSEHVEYSSVRNIIVGCARLSSFVCFDEFNRLTSGVMSAAANCLYEHREKVKVFLTMNVGYKGRHDLPRSLRALFGEVCVDRPDVGEIVYYHTGCYKLHNLLRDLQDQCSRAFHYDFGLRAVSCIVDGRDMPGDLVDNLICFYMAVLLPEDKLIFADLLKRYYSVEIDVDSGKYVPASLLRRALRKRNGALLCGEAGMMTVLECLGGKENAYVYNPTNLLLTEHSIFGTLDKATGEWRDSKFVKDLRNAREPSWFIFDGIVRSEWIEDFNSILDDNRAVCLGSGERLKVSEHFKFIFISKSLYNVTPATLTRVFLMYTPRLPSDSLKYYSVADAPAALLKRHVLFIMGKRGVGKKDAVHRMQAISAGGGGRVISAVDCDVGTFMKMIDAGGKVTMYIDEFNKSSGDLQEIVREFWRSCTIASIRHRQLKVVCAFDCGREDEDGAVSIIRGIVGDGSIDVIRMEVPDINRMIRERISAFSALPGQADGHKESMVEALLAVYEEQELSVQEFLRYMHFVEMIGFTANKLNFAARLFYDDNDGLANSIERVLKERVSKEFMFNPATCLFEECCVELELSRLCCLLYHRQNVVIRGPRLCGKRMLLDRAIAALNRPDVASAIKIIHWLSEAADSLEAGKDCILVYITVEKMSKQIYERAVEIELKQEVYELDCVKYLKECENTRAGKHCRGRDGRQTQSDESRSHGEQMGSPNDAEFSSAYSSNTKPSKNGTFIIDVDGEYHHPDTCAHEPVTFNCLYRYLDYKATLERVYADLRNEALERQAFLRRGIEKIEEFKKEAAALGQAIAEKKHSMEQGISTINVLIDELLREEAAIKEEEKEVNKKKALLEGEIRAGEGKKHIIDVKLRAIEPLLVESKEAISKITKGHLSEIKAMSSPPSIIRRTIETVYFLLEGRRTSEWKELLLYIKRDDFISKILNHDKSAKNNGGEVRIEYSPDFSVERAEKASKACGALFRWMLACSEYHCVSRDIAPLKREVEQLEEKIMVQNEGVTAEESKLALLREQLVKQQERHAASRNELEALRREISELEAKMVLLKTAAERLEDETDKWTYVECECPVKFMAEGRFIAKYSKNAYVKATDAHVFNTKEYVEIFLDDKNYKKAIVSAQAYGRNVIIKNADRYDRHVYDLLKSRMGQMHGPMAVVCGNYGNCYEYETYELRCTPVIGDPVDDCISEVENHLLELLARGDLEEIIRQKDLLDRERRAVEDGRLLIEYSTALGLLFMDMRRRFGEDYGVGTSLGVYKEVLKKFEEEHGLAGSLPDASCAASGFLMKFYEHSFPGADIQFDVSEVSKYSFDYTFFTSFNGLLYQLRSKISFDIEISAGSPESNNAISDLLAEQAQKCVLVLNAHFLPPLVKTGTNRFIFVLDCGERHPIIEHTRIVHCDRNIPYESMRDQIQGMFNTSSAMAGFHAFLLSRGQNFSLNDLETVLKHREISDGYLRDIIYYNRMDDEVKKDIIEEWGYLNGE